MDIGNLFAVIRWVGVLRVLHTDHIAYGRYTSLAPKNRCKPAEKVKTRVVLTWSRGGWIVSYLEVARHGNASGAAWVASGFYLGTSSIHSCNFSISLSRCYAGLAVGRLCLPIINHIAGERRIVLFYILLAGALQAVSWAAKSFVAVSLSQPCIYPVFLAMPGWLKRMDSFRQP